LNLTNGDGPSTDTACPDDCADCYAGRRLHLLAQKLANRGLHAQVVPSGVHDDRIKVTNPGAPERGAFYVERDGCVTWEHTGTLDDDGIGKLVDEAITALRANGIRLPRREKKQP
jgi:hypothetical protein